MRSEMLKGPMPRSLRRFAMPGFRRCAAALLMLAIPAVSGCVTAGPILAEAGHCSAYIPAAWRSPVPPAPLPEGDAVGAWIAALDAQTGQLDKANGRLIDTLHIVGECERRAAGAIKASRPRFLGIF